MIYPIKHLPRDIPVGIQTETGVEAIGFDMKPWMDEFDGLKFSVWATRPGENAAYPAADVELVGTVLYWKPNSVDTEIAGNGKVEILAITGDKRKLSGWCETNVKATSLAVTQEVPEAARPWVDEVLDAADEAKRQADRAEKIANDMSGVVISGVVRYDEEQSLTEEEKAQARKNIGADVGVNFTTDETLNLSEDGVLSVNMADDVEDDSNLPVTSAAVKAALDKIPNTGSSNVYVGADEPPEGAEVWIDPEAEISPDEIPGVKVEETEEGVVVTATSWDGVTKALVRHGKDAEGSTVQVDKTLTIENVAADAKVTGDRFTALTEEMAELKESGTGGSGGDSPAIIDVVELPETDIREDVFYRVTTASFYFDNEQDNNLDCIVVETLPDVGIPAINADMTEMTFYYAVDTVEVSAYATEEIGAAYGIPSGWYPAEMVMQIANIGYGGVVTSVDEIADDGKRYLLIENDVRYRNNGKWESVQGVARQGAGNSSAIFNSTDNEANGACSTAKGYKTVANGEYSSTEGQSTVAVGRAQKVWGVFNTIDEVEDVDIGKGKYIHIVGNGNNLMHRRNAHTLDWNGNAWFAGGIELTSPNGTRYRFTVSDDGTLNATAVTE